MSRRKTTGEFILDAKRVHGDKYDYSKVEYINSTTKVCIICPVHGEFWQTPNTHLGGRGCPKCSGRYRTTEEFIKLAKQVHGDKYDYSKVDYKNTEQEVTITCPVHGDFVMKPSKHLSDGQGCLQCAIKKRKEDYLLSQEEYINRCLKIHGQLYNLSQIKYSGNKNNVTPICSKHGMFSLRADCFLKGQGCPECSLQYSKLENLIARYCEVNKIDFIYQKRFDWLGLLSIDFYLPDFDIGIECQGGQHYKVCGYFGGNQKLFEQKERDSRKFELCELNNLKLFYFTEKRFIKYQPEAYCDADELFNAIKSGEITK